MLLAYYFLHKVTNISDYSYEVEDKALLNQSNSSTFAISKQGANDQQISEINPERSPEEEIQRILSNNINYWENWNWQSNLAETRILKVDTENKELTLVISRPNNHSYSDKTVRSLIKCSPDNTAIIYASEPLKIVQSGNIDLISEASPYDVLHAYCLDPNCLNFGRQCILTETDK